MLATSVYGRKVSSEEAREGYILVLKNKLSFFGGAGASFTLVRGGAVRVARVEAYDCACVGPEAPHQHYFVRCAGLNAGDRVEIEKAPSHDERYVLQIIPR